MCDWEDMELESRLYPWLDDPSPEALEEMEDYPWEEE